MTATPFSLFRRRLVVALGCFVVATAAMQNALLAQDAKPAEAPAFEKPTEWINALGVSADGKLLAAASTSHAVAVWEVATGKLVRSVIFPMTQNGPGAVMVSEDATTVFVGNGARRRGSKGAAIVHFDLESGSQSGQSTADPNWVHVFARSPKADVVATIGSGWDDSIRLWDKGAMRPVRIWPAHKSRVSALAMSRDGRRLATSGSTSRKTGRDPSLKIWDAATGRELLKMVGHKEGATSLAFSANGRRLISVGDDAIKTWNVDTGALLGSVTHVLAKDEGVYEALVAPDATWVALVTHAADGVTNGYTIKSAADGRTLAKWTSPSQTGRELAASPDGKLLFTGGNDGVVIAYDVKTGKVVRTFTLDDKPAIAAKKAFDEAKAKAAETAQ